MPPALAYSRELFSPTPTTTTLLAEALDSLSTAADRAAAIYRRAFDLGRRDGATDHQQPFVGRWTVGEDVEPLTFFHSRDALPMSLATLFERVRRYWPKRFDDDTIGLCALVLVLRYQEHTTLPVTTAMIHRLFLAAVLVAAKVHHDDPVSNSRFAARTGLQTKELARMERALLVGIGFRGVVTMELITPDGMRAQLAAANPHHLSSFDNDDVVCAAPDDADFIASDTMFADSGRPRTPPLCPAPASPGLIPIVRAM